MATAVGKDGSLTLPSGNKAKFNGFALIMAAALVNTTGFDSSGYEENELGLKSGAWTATGSFLYDAATTSPGLPGTKGNATFQIATGCTYAASVVISQIQAGSDVNGAATVVFAGRTSGAITLTWDETGS